MSYPSPAEKRETRAVNRVLLASALLTVAATVAFVWVTTP